MASPPYKYPKPLWRIMKNDRSLIHLDIGTYPQNSSHDTFWPSISAEWHTLYKAIQQNTEISEIRISNQNGDKSCQRVLLDGLLKNRCIRKVHLFGIDLDQWLISKICHYVRRNRMKAGLAELHISNCTVAHKEFADFLFRTEHYLHSLSLNGLHTEYLLCFAHFFCEFIISANIRS